MHPIRYAAGVIFFLIAGVPAFAQDCPARAAILSLSDTLLEGREALPKLQARGYGAEAAYLKIRYAPLDDSEAEALLTGLLAKDIRDIRDVAFAWATARLGLERALAIVGEEAGALALRSPTTIRALIAADAEEIVVEAMAELEIDSELVGSVHTAILDLPEPMKAKLFALADQGGLFFLAAGIAALMDDQSAWDNILSDIEVVINESMATEVAQRFRHLPMFIGRPARPVLNPDPHSEALQEELDRILAAAARLPQFEFLNPYFNQTGYIDEVLAAAAALEAGLDDGTINAKGSLDAAWLSAYRGMREANLPTGLDDNLKSIALGDRPFRPQVADVLDWIIAVNALAPYLRGETDSLPDAPHGPGGSFAAGWPEWQVLAEAARGAPDSIAAGSDERSGAMAAELLLGAGEYDAAATLVSKMPASQTSLRLAADFALRLDRLCESYLWHPAESVVLAGTPIYKFDDAGIELPTAAAADAGGAKN